MSSGMSATGTAWSNCATAMRYSGVSHSSGAWASASGGLATARGVYRPLPLSVHRSGLESGCRPRATTRITRARPLPDSPRPDLATSDAGVIVASASSVMPWYRTSFGHGHTRTTSDRGTRSSVVSLQQTSREAGIPSERVDVCSAPARSRRGRSVQLSQSWMCERVRRRRHWRCREFHSRGSPGCSGRPDTARTARGSVISPDRSVRSVDPR